MKNYIVRDSLICGVSLMLINLLVVASGYLTALIVTSHILPGFLFSLVLIQKKNTTGLARKIIFVLLATGLNFLAGWIAMGGSFIGKFYAATFPVGNLFGATILFLLYFLFIERNLSISKGIFLSAAAGLIGSAAPIIADALSRSNHDAASWQSFLYSAGFFTIFPVWQGLFALAVELSRKEIHEASPEVLPAS